MEKDEKNKKIGKREWKKEVSLFCLLVSMLEKTDPDIRYEIWTDYGRQTIRLIENHLYEGREVTVIEDCDIDTFGIKLKEFRMKLEGI